MFVRGQSGWSLEQQVPPGGAGCYLTLGPREIALSGDGDTLLVGDPNCEQNGVQDVGSVDVYTRSGDGWTPAQSIEPPESQARGFGSVVALSDDGSTAAISMEQSSGLAAFAGAAWVYEHDAGGWQARARVAATEPEAYAGFDCLNIVAGGQRIICGGFDAVGFNAEQGSIYAFERPAAGWGAPVAPPQRVFAPEGLAGDALGDANARGWQEYAVSDDGSLLDAPIEVTNVASGAYPDDIIGYEFTAPPVYSAPNITSISPASGGAGTELMIAGTDLNGASALSIGGVPVASFTVRSPTLITAVVQAGARSGPVSLTAPAGSASGAESFTFVAREGRPQVSSATPAEGPTAGGTALTIRGSNFGLDSTVTVGAAAADVSVRSETEITAVTSAQSAGSDEVVVSDEGGASTGGPSFTYVALPPVVSSIAPAEGSTAGGTAVTIRGANFEAGATVTIGGAASEVVVHSSGEITAVTSAQPAGTEEVLVSDEAGNSQGGPTFTYTVPPTVSSVTPSEGPVKGRRKVTITGSHFVPGATVTIGGAATAVRVHSETKITATTAPEPAGSYEVVVSDSHGISSGGPSYTYVDPSADAAVPALETGPAIDLGFVGSPAHALAWARNARDPDERVRRAGGARAGRAAAADGGAGGGADQGHPRRPELRGHAPADELLRAEGDAADGPGLGGGGRARGHRRARGGADGRRGRLRGVRDRAERAACSRSRTGSTTARRSR